METQPPQPLPSPATTPQPTGDEEGPLIQSPDRLARLTDEQMYNTFYVPVLRKMANDSAEIRNELFVNGGVGAWSLVRASGFMNRTRPPTHMCVPIERHIRSFESRVALELCFRGNV